MSLAALSEIRRGIHEGGGFAYSAAQFCQDGKLSVHPKFYFAALGVGSRFASAPMDAGWCESSASNSMNAPETAQQDESDESDVLGKTTDAVTALLCVVSDWKERTYSCCISLQDICTPVTHGEKSESSFRVRGTVPSWRFFFSTFFRQVSEGKFIVAQRSEHEPIIVEVTSLMCQLSLNRVERGIAAASMLVWLGRKLGDKLIASSTLAKMSSSQVPSQPLNDCSLRPEDRSAMVSSESDKPAAPAIASANRVNLVNPQFRGELKRRRGIKFS